MTTEKLKKSILQQAIQGKLVPQTPYDEPASTLLDRIREEKSRLVAEGKIKRDKKESVIYRADDGRYIERIGKTETDITDQIHFGIPKSWEWVRGKSVFDAMESTKPSGEHFTYIDINAVDNISNTIHRPKILPTEKAPSRATRKLHEGDILFSLVRPYLKNIALVEDNNKNAIASTGFYVISGTRFYDVKFLLYLLLSPYVVDGLNQFIKGEHSPSINNSHIENYLYPLPPLEEQKRIVEKIEELMPLVEEYGKAQSRLDELNSSLGDNLRKSILQYAIQGKLVPQNPEDEPTSVLLNRIRDEKARLISEGKIKRDKNKSVIYRTDNGRYIERIGKTETDITDQVPFEIPNSWEWVRLRDVSIIQEGPGIRSFQYKTDGVQLLTVTNILEGTVDLNKSKKFISQQEYEEKYSHFQLNNGDIVTACSGGSWGKSSFYTIADCKIILNTSTLRLRFFGDKADNNYLYILTKSHIFKQQLANQLSGMQPNFGYAHYSKILIPLPPLAEQKRIVERIEQIFSLCK